MPVSLRLDTCCLTPIDTLSAQNSRLSPASSLSATLGPARDAHWNHLNPIDAFLLGNSVPPGWSRRSSYPPPGCSLPRGIHSRPSATFRIGEKVASLSLESAEEWGNLSHAARSEGYISSCVRPDPSSAPSHVQTHSTSVRSLCSPRLLPLIIYCRM